MNGNNNLPLNWSLVKLGDVGEIIGGGTPSTKVKDYFDGNIAWITPADLTGYKNKVITFGRRNITEVGLKNSSARIIPKGSILFSSRAPIGYVVIAANDLSTNQGFKTLVPTKKILSEFVYYYLKSSKQIAEKHASGTTFKEISAKNFANLPIPLPPISVQQKIVEKIEQLFSELDTGVASLKKAKEQIKTYRQTVLASAFSGRLCRNLTRLPDGQVNQIPFGEQKNFINEIPTNLSRNHLNPIQVRNLINKDDLLRDRQEVEIEHLPYKQGVNIAEERLNSIQEVTSINKAAEPQTQYGLNQDSSDYRISRIESENKSSESFNLENPGSDNYANNLPEGWKWVKLGNIAEVKRGKSKHRPRNAPKLFGGKYPFIQTGEIREANGGTIKKHNKTYNDIGLAQSKLWPSGTLCISIAANIGETAFLGFEACFPDSVVGIVPNYEVLIGKYINYFFIKDKNKISNLAPATAQKNINVDILQKLDIPLPSLNQQFQIVEEIEKRFSEADNLEKAIDESLSKAESLRQSILKQAFEGRLV